MDLLAFFGAMMNDFVRVWITNYTFASAVGLQCEGELQRGGGLHTTGVDDQGIVRSPTVFLLASSYPVLTSFVRGLNDFTHANPPPRLPVPLSGTLPPSSPVLLQFAHSFFRMCVFTFFCQFLGREPLAQPKIETSSQLHQGFQNHAGEVALRARFLV